jgi:O-antigen/teichoic acid export membrane protein
LRPRFIKNARANLCRGGAAAVVAILLPPVLVRHMDPADYAVWVLVLQVVAYVGFLDFGLQTAIGRYIAFSTEKNDQEERNGIFSTVFAGLLVAALILAFYEFVFVRHSQEHTLAKSS